MRDAAGRAAATPPFDQSKYEDAAAEQDQAGGF